MVRLMGVVAVLLVGLVSADSGGIPVINRGSQAWHAGFAAAPTEVRTTPSRHGGMTVVALFAFTGHPTPYARCKALFEVKHVQRGDLPVWPMPANITLGSKAGLEYRAGWVERCLRTRP